MPIDWTSKLRHFFLVVAFCLAIAAIQVAFTPERPYGPPAVYSLCIGLVTWAVIDLGRHGFASAAETGWPPGLRGLALVACGIAAGWGLGNLAGEWLCRNFNLFPGEPTLDPDTELRHGVLITVLAGVVGSFYFYAISRSAYLKQQMTMAREQATQAQLKLLQAQLEPHMLFNTLANLRALIATDPRRAQAMLDRLDGFLRATLAASRASTHPLSQEFDRLRDYLELMAVRMGPRLRYSLHLPDDLADVPVPALLLQPLVENAIRHGLEPAVDGGEVRVAARRDGDRLVLTVSDSGVGLPAPAPQPSAPAGSSASPAGTTPHAHAAQRGFGLGQVCQRLHTLYGTRASMSLAAGHGGGTHAELSLPLESLA